MTTRLTLYTREDRAKAVEAVSHAGKGFVIEIKPPTRSSEQSNLMWSKLDDISTQVEWYGERLTSEEWKCVISAGLKKQKVVPGIDGGFVAIGARTSHMTIEEMGELIDFMDFFGAQKGVVWKIDPHTELPGKDSGGEAGALERGHGAGAPAEAQRRGP